MGNLTPSDVGGQQPLLTCLISAPFVSPLSSFYSFNLIRLTRLTHWAIFLDNYIYVYMHTLHILCDELKKKKNVRIYRGQNKK